MRIVIMCEVPEGLDVALAQHLSIFDNFHPGCDFSMSVYEPPDRAGERLWPRAVPPRLKVVNLEQEGD